jgi:hypothetical protein
MVATREPAVLAEWADQIGAGTKGSWRGGRRPWETLPDHVGRSRYGSPVSATADDLTTHAAHPLAAHHPIGISTGVFASARGDWPELVAEACRVSTFAVELSALSGNELPGLIAYLQARPRMPFRYMSVHAPAKNSEQDEAATNHDAGGATALGEVRRGPS